MEKVEYEGEIYSNLFRVNDGTLMKYSHLEIEAVLLLMVLNLMYLNTPVKFSKLTDEESKEHNGIFEYKSKIYVPYLEGYTPLYSETITYSMYTEEILKLVRRIILLIKDMHEHGVIHSDLNPKNIMINEYLDINFIDLDQAIIGDYVSNENVVANDNITLNEKKHICKVSDKQDILSLLLYYLLHGNFRKDDFMSVDVKNIMLRKNLEEELSDIQRRNDINDSYYFLDIIDELLRIGYESPIIIAKRKMKEYC